MKKKNVFKSLDKIATEIPVSAVMVKDIRKLKEDDTADKAIELMSKYSISGLIICDKKDYPVGIVSEGDLLKKVFHKRKDPKKIKIKDVMTKDLFTIKPSQSIGETSLLMKKQSISKLPVVENNKLVGYVTKSDLLEELNEIYRQNRRLQFMIAVNAIQLIIIVILIMLYLNK